MQYELLKYRGLQPDPCIDGMKLLYFYGKYKKEREDARNQKPANVTKAY